MRWSAYGSHRGAQRRASTNEAGHVLVVCEERVLLGGERELRQKESPACWRKSRAPQPVIAISSPQSRLEGMNTSLIAIPLLSVAERAADAEVAQIIPAGGGERIGGRPRGGLGAGADRDDLAHGAAELGQSLECVEAEFLIECA